MEQNTNVTRQFQNNGSLETICNVSTPITNILPKNTPTEIAIISIYLIGTFGIALFLNITLVVSIRSQEHLQEVAYFVISIAYIICDVSGMIVYTPTAIMHTLGYGEAITQGFCFLQGILLMTIIYPIPHLLMLLSLERYFYFCRPFKHPKVFTPMKLRIAIICVFLITVVYHMPYTFIYRDIYNDAVEMLCHRPRQDMRDPYWICMCLLYYVIVVFTQIITFVQIFRLIVHHRQSIASLSGPNVTHGSDVNVTQWTTLQSHIKTVIGVACVSGLFWLQCLPIAIVNVLYGGSTMNVNAMYAHHWIVLIIRTISYDSWQLAVKIILC